MAMVVQKEAKEEIPLSESCLSMILLHMSLKCLNWKKPIPTLR